MKKMKRERKTGTKKRLPLPEDLEKRLSVYALAAGAAGVSMLALAPAAKADITYQDVNISLTQGTTQYLNINSVNELGFDNSLFQRTRSHHCTIVDIFCQQESHTVGTLFMKSVSGGAEVMTNVASYGILAPQRLAAGAAIGQSANNFAKASNLILAADSRLRYGNYAFGNLTQSSGRSNVSGEWANRNGYLGFEFFNSKGSKSYFGWAHLSVHATAENISGKLLSFAYDTCAGQTIEAGQTTGGACSEPVSTPEPGTLSLLALGAVGLLALRKKRQVVAERESVA